MSMVDVDQVRGLRRTWRTTVPKAFGDANGHMNVRYHLAIHDDACWSLHKEFGFTDEYLRDSRRGMFAREHHLSYLNEVLVGDEVSVYVRVLRRSAKTIHLFQYLVDERSGRVASILEQASVHVDLSTRSAAEFQFPGPVDEVDRQLHLDGALPWIVQPHLQGARR